ncbi:MAG: hypothetical protein Q9167_007432 [Letrouitia subvulpina]
MASSQSSGYDSSQLDDLGPDSYTIHRLKHASPNHLHITSRRCFIGPVPEGWLKSHRKSWYRQYINYSSRASTFSASPNISDKKRVTGLDATSPSARFSQSFPQPAGIDIDDKGDEDKELESAPEGRRTLNEVESNAEGTNEGEYSGTNTVSNHNEGDVPSKPPPRPKFRDRLTSKGLVQNESVASFVTAPSEPSSPKGKAKQPARKKRASFVTALEPAQPVESSTIKDDTQSPSVNDSPTSGDVVDSKTSLIRHKSPEVPQHYSQNHSNDGTSDKRHSEAKSTPGHVNSGMVRFDVPSGLNQRDGETNSSITKISHRRSWRHLRHGGQPHPGEIVKTEKMLVRVDYTKQQLPDEYNENDSVKTESRTLEKWREYVAVCRESQYDQESDFAIQLYKTRVIPATDRSRTSKGWLYEVPLIRRSTHVNLYSSLDKTLVIWMPWKEGSKIFILRPRSAASSVEWYTFIRNALGWKRSRALQVNVPDLSVCIQLNNPFQELEDTRDAAHAAHGEEKAVMRTMEAERAVAGLIIRRCVDMLKESQEWRDILDRWLEYEKMGLAWKRYDRLEWVHGANEQKMYGTIAMQKSHELELRPKKHYPTNVTAKHQDELGEPAPLEGFLIRLTSQRGRVQRIGKMFFKRLYFVTHNQYLCYCRPAKARPPPPPRMSFSRTVKVPSASEITDKIPLIYSVNPYPTKDGKIEWLQESFASKQRHDEEAYTEAARRVDTLLNADGYINLCQIVQVRNVHRGSTPADARVDQGPDVGFHEEVPDSTRDDGKTNQFDDDRTFELVLDNHLIVRLQAFNEETKKEWMTRLLRLVDYWKLRKAEDMTALKATRQANLERLDIDEQMEAVIGQFAEKWEVTRAVASSELYNICGISCCRAITMSGSLYRKPRRHTTFHKCGVILCHSHLMVFHGTLRKRTGEKIPHIQHERDTAIALKNCYIYSGLVTEGDLLYQNKTFDPNHPGHHALPRVYLEDGWTSTDEDTMTTFVLWQPRRKSFFKEGTQDGGRLRYVSRLGVPGRSMVFKARSRAERDHWVMSIGMEIERLQGGEEIRVVEKK